MIGMLDADMEKLQREVSVPKEYLLSSEQCKETRDTVKEQAAAVPHATAFIC
jgi:hypothetical protein